MQMRKVPLRKIVSYLNMETIIEKRRVSIAWSAIV